MKTTLIIIILSPFLTWAQASGSEFHASVNLPLNQGKTYLGAGGGVNFLLRDTCRVNFKTGIEVNYFQTWDASAYYSKMSSRKNLHYRFTALTLPAFARFNFGDRVKWFLEAGVYVGFGLGGRVTFSQISYPMYPNDPTTVFEGGESCFSGLSVTPAAGLGFRFPLSERIDLLLKPEFAYVRNKLEDVEFSANKTKTGSGYGGSHEYDFSFMYVRVCAGIHLKPKKATKNNVTKIPPLHP